MLDDTVIFSFRHTDYHVAYADIALVARHASSDADNKSLLDGRESASNIRGDGCGGTFPLGAGKAREDNIIATELAEDVYIRATLPGG